MITRRRSATPLPVAVAARAVALVALLATPAGAAKVKTIGTGTASGGSADVSVDGEIKRPQSIWIAVTATPAVPLDGFVSLSCSRRNGSSSNFLDFEPMVPPFELTAPLPVRRPEGCSVYANAYVDDFESASTVGLTVYGTQYRKKKRRRH